MNLREWDARLIVGKHTAIRDMTNVDHTDDGDPVFNYVVHPVQHVVLQDVAGGRVLLLFVNGEHAAYPDAFPYYVYQLPESEDM